MQAELSKPEKKLARELIDKGLQQEYVNAITDLDAIITDWKNKKQNNMEAYLALYKTLDKHDDHIADRYNNLGGSKYLMTVGVLLADGLITNEDIAGFSEENKQRLNLLLSYWNR